MYTVRNRVWRADRAVSVGQSRELDKLKEEVNRSVILVNRADAATRNKQRQLEQRDRDIGIAFDRHDP